MTSCMDGSCNHDDDGACVMALCVEVERLRAERDRAHRAGLEEMRERVERWRYLFRAEHINPYVCVLDGDAAKPILKLDDMFALVLASMPPARSGNEES